MQKSFNKNTATQGAQPSHATIPQQVATLPTSNSRLPVGEGESSTASPMHQR